MFLFGFTFSSYLIIQLNIWVQFSKEKNRYNRSYILCFRYIDTTKSLELCYKRASQHLHVTTFQHHIQSSLVMKLISINFDYFSQNFITKQYCKQSDKCLERLYAISFFSERCAFYPFDRTIRFRSFSKHYQV